MAPLGWIPTGVSASPDSVTKRFAMMRPEGDTKSARDPERVTMTVTVAVVVVVEGTTIMAVNAAPVPTAIAGVGTISTISPVRGGISTGIAVAAVSPVD